MPHVITVQRTNAHDNILDAIQLTMDLVQGILEFPDQSDLHIWIYLCSMLDIPYAMEGSDLIAWQMLTSDSRGHKHAYRPAAMNWLACKLLSHLHNARGI